jgi:hypothetical protein
MGDRYDIGVDVGEGKDKTFATLLRIGEDGKYVPVISTDNITWADSIQRTGYVGAEAREYTFSAEVTYVQEVFNSLCDFSKDCERIAKSLPKVIKSWTEFIYACEGFRGKQRKTTYKTIRRDCAKRNKNN